MLILARSLRELRFGELMEVYADSNAETARQWFHYPSGFALQRAEDDHRQYLQDIFFRTPGAFCALWQEKGKYVCALRMEPYKDGLLLEALETAPSCRRKGYAVSLIRSVQSSLRASGAVRIYSHVDKRNISSLKTHEACGFSRISDGAVYINGSVDYRCCTLLYEA